MFSFEQEQKITSKMGTLETQASVRKVGSTAFQMQLSRSTKWPSSLCVCRILVREKAHNFNRTSFPILSGFPLEDRNFQFYLENRSTFGIISSTSHINMNEPMSDLSMTTQGRNDSNI